MGGLPGGFQAAQQGFGGYGGYGGGMPYANYGMPAMGANYMGGYAAPGVGLH